MNPFKKLAIKAVAVVLGGYMGFALFLLFIIKRADEQEYRAYLRLHPKYINTMSKEDFCHLRSARALPIN
jgi:hypothetical protein